MSSFTVSNGAPVAPALNGSYAVAANIGETKTYLMSVNEKLASPSITLKMVDANGTPIDLPTGLAVTFNASGSGQTVYELTLATNAHFALGTEVDNKVIDLIATLVDVAGNSTQLALKATIHDVALVGNAVMADALFSDNAGPMPMTKLHADGSFPPYPYLAADISNPAYAPTLCGAGPTPFCYDPIHSHWAVDTSVSDPAGRAILYSVAVAAGAPSTPPDIVAAMRATLTLDAAGRLSQTCYADAMGAMQCVDPLDPGNWTSLSITVIATPASGGMSLRRSFLLKVRDDG
ncbi:MAG: hypothetical protein V4484_00060 [Pseudomonadota bacterium]